MRISDWSSDVCSSDLLAVVGIDRFRTELIKLVLIVGNDFQRADRLGALFQVVLLCAVPAGAPGSLVAAVLLHGEETMALEPIPFRRRGCPIVRQRTHRRAVLARAGPRRLQHRSEARRGGKGGGSTWRYRWWPSA